MKEIMLLAFSLLILGCATNKPYNYTAPNEDNNRMEQYGDSVMPGEEARVPSIQSKAPY